MSGINGYSPCDGLCFSNLRHPTINAGRNDKTKITSIGISKMNKTSDPNASTISISEVPHRRNLYSPNKNITNENQLRVSAQENKF